MFDKIVSRDPEASIVQKWSAKFDPAFERDEFAGSVGSRRFRNPSAYHVDEAAREVVHYVLTGEKSEQLAPKLADLCHLIALWTPPASVTLAPFVKLRELVASELGGFDANSKEAHEMGARIDECTLMAVEYYVQSREQVMHIRLNELKRKTDNLERVLGTAETGMGDI